MRLQLILSILAVALPLASGIANATPRDELADAARAFDEAVLRNQDDSSQQVAPRKWMGPIRIAVRNPAKAPNLVPHAINAIRSIAKVANIEVSEVEKEVDANFVIFFDENETNGKINCVAWARLKNWAVSGVDIKINPSYRGRLDNCIIHEALHGFGLLSHPHAADSVLSYVYQRSTLTPLDVNLIKTLYDPALKPGTAPLAASVAASQRLAELMSSSEADRQEVCSPRKRAERTANGESFLITTATLKRTAGKCGERATYWVNLYPDKLSFGFVDIWRSFTPDAAGVYGGSFTVDAKPKPLDFKLSGNLKTRVVSAQNLTQECAWEGTLN